MFTEVKQTETPIFEGIQYVSNKVRSDRLKFHAEDYSDGAKRTWDDWVKRSKDEAFGFHVTINGRNSLR